MTARQLQQRNPHVAQPIGEVKVRTHVRAAVRASLLVLFLRVRCGKLLVGEEVFVAALVAPVLCGFPSPRPLCGEVK